MMNEFKKIKRRKFCGIVLIIISSIICVTLTGCFGNNNDNENEENLANDDVITSKLDELLENENILKNYVQDEYFDLTENNISNDDAESISGVLGSYIGDVDSDEVNEAVIFRLDNNSIIAELYELESEELKQKYTYEILSDVFRLDIINVNGFIKELDGVITFYIEYFEEAGIVAADGITEKIICFTLEDEKENVLLDTFIAGSAIPDEELNPFIEDVEAVGLAVGDDVANNIYEENKDCELLFNIERKNLDILDSSYISYYAKIATEKVYGVTYINFEDKEHDINSFIGSYIWEGTNSNTGTDDTIYFSLEKEDDGSFYYYLSLYPNNAMHASEELWGTWEIDGPKTNESPTSLAKYTISNIIYEGDTITFDIKLDEYITEEYKDYVIPDETYTFTIDNTEY